MSAKRTPAAAPHGGRGIWWTILILTGAVSLFLNIWHALHPAPPDGGGPAAQAAGGAVGAAAEGVDAGRLILALILGVFPVVVAALLSHTFIVPTPRPVRVVVVALFLVGMAMSMTAQVEVLRPVAGADARALGLVALVDIPALLSLYMLAVGVRTPADRSAKDAAPAAPAPVAPAPRPVAETPVRPVADRLPELPAEQPRPVAPPVAAPVAPPVDPTPDRSPRPVAEPAPDRSPTGPPVEAEPPSRPVAEPRPARRTQPKAPAADALSTRDRARLLLAGNPALSGADLARELGVSPERGRALRREVLAEGTPTETPSEARVTPTGGE